MSDNTKASSFPILPVKSTVLFPYLVLPLSVGRPGSVAAVEAALASEERTLVVLAQKDASVEKPSLTELYSIGTRAIIKKMTRSADVIELIVQGVERVRIGDVDQINHFLSAQVVPVPVMNDHGPEVEALQREVFDQATRIQTLAQPQSPIGLPQLLSQVNDPLKQVYLLASMLSLDLDKEQALLEANSSSEALRLIHSYLKHEIEVLELRQKIASQAETEMTREKREYILRQQLRAIQNELGDKNSEQAEAQGLREKLEKADLPEEVRKETMRELGRLERLPAAAPDYQITRSYLELVGELPWRRTTEDNLDLKRARDILDADHYDLKEVKQRIIEHLAVLKLNPNAKAPILCFVGPPGVGKTSLGESIAKALGRVFERMSLGGMHDEAELRGHRRTYIGAMPGRIIQAIRRAGVKNPLLMLDELDKLGRDFRGDPAAALLEILDPAQNGNFRDNYLDMPFDLSKVFFVATANTLETIPQPLLDRMEVLRLSGYTEEEKVEIAKRYLIARQLRQTGLTADQVCFTDEAIGRVIRRYTREAGVRQLERTIGRLARKVAVKFAEGNTAPVTVRADDLGEMLGPERFYMEEARKHLLPGIATGLAWTEAGGDVLYVEATMLPEGKGLVLTGQLGEVMKESAQAAKSYLWSRADELGIPKERFSQAGVHIHVPAGAIPKDGPSAGVTMATALASLYMGLVPRSDTAMTGEITLSGLVLPVGGIKEKVLAARRAGINRVILPKDNAKDLADLPEGPRQEMEFVLAEHVDEVLEAAIPGVANRLHNTQAKSA